MFLTLKIFKRLLRLLKVEDRVNDRPDLACTDQPVHILKPNVYIISTLKREQRNWYSILLAGAYQNTTNHRGFEENLEDYFAHIGILRELVQTNLVS